VPAARIVPTPDEVKDGEARLGLRGEEALAHRVVISVAHRAHRGADPSVVLSKRERWRVSDWGQPVTIGGVRVNLGDVIVADQDGVVVVPRRAAHEVLGRCERLVGTENRVRTAVKRGITPLAAYEKFGRF
jgi:hypothetical protein